MDEPDAWRDRGSRLLGRLMAPSLALGSLCFLVCARTCECPGCSCAGKKCSARTPAQCRRASRCRAAGQSPRSVHPEGRVCSAHPLKFTLLDDSLNNPAALARPGHAAADIDSCTSVSALRMLQPATRTEKPPGRHTRSRVARRHPVPAAAVFSCDVCARGPAFSWLFGASTAGAMRQHPTSSRADSSSLVTVECARFFHTTFISSVPRCSCCRWWTTRAMNSPRYDHQHQIV